MKTNDQMSSTQPVKNKGHVVSILAGKSNYSKIFAFAAKSELNPQTGDQIKSD